jgi:hypothetical protein
MIYVAIYLAAIVVANLSVAALGPQAVIVNAFLLIGLDLTLRDKLHDRWNNDQLALRMGALILAGGVISYVLNRDAGKIAVASTVAFAVAATLDALVYARMRAARSVRLPDYPYWRPRWSRLERINGSNLVGAAADSLLFPTIAFGSLMPAIVIGQFLAKVAGGFLWSLVLTHAVPLRRRPA